MPYSEAQKRASRKYSEKTYDRIELRVVKGKKADLQTHAKMCGESLNSFVNRAIDEAVGRDKEGAT
jgi:predicted HicB family RNase H-like nuclease